MKDQDISIKFYGVIDRFKLETLIFEQRLVDWDSGGAPEKSQSLSFSGIPKI